MDNNTPPYLVRPSTAVISRGFDPRLSVGSARPAVFRSSTYVFSSPEAAERAFAVALDREPGGDDVELIYSRLSHPNAEILETHLIALEPQALAAAVFNSGLAAISTILLTFCRPGRSFIYTTPIYGGTYHLIDKILLELGIRAIPVLAGDTQQLVHAIGSTPDLDLIFIETPANPTLLMTDIDAVAQAAARLPIPPLTVVDNTFMGPAFQHPLKLGADLVMYSATKFLAGFSDMLAGVVMGSKLKHIQQLQGTRAILGNILQPDECWMLDSRLPTVHLRMERQSKNTVKIIENLKNHPAIERIFYPALIEDPDQQRIRDRQCLYFGSLFALQLKGGKKEAFNFLRHLKIIKNAVSLGGMESLTSHPATTTHSELSPDQQRQLGITDNMVRLSIGIEDWQDILGDIEQALDQV